MRKLTLLIPIYVILYIWCIVSCKSQDHSGPSGPAEEEVETVTCVDKIQNGDETDIDCGGSTCPECKSNQKCVTSTDCVSNICEDDTRQCAEIEVDSEKAVEIALKLHNNKNENNNKKTSEDDRIEDTDTIVEDGEIRDKARLNETMSNETMHDRDEIEMVEKNLVNTYHSPGKYKVEWNGKNMFDEEIASGIYFGCANICRLKASNKNIT